MQGTTRLCTEFVLVLEVFCRFGRRTDSDAPIFLPTLTTSVYNGYMLYVLSTDIRLPWPYRTRGDININVGLDSLPGRGLGPVRALAFDWAVRPIVVNFHVSVSVSGGGDWLRNF
jgi:hypothetical protein